MSKYLRDQASSRDAIRQRLLGHRALPITDAPMPVTSSRPVETTSGLEGLLQQIKANLAPKGVAQVATPELKVAPGGVSRASGDGGRQQDSGLGGALSGIFDQLGKGGGMKKTAEELAKASGRASLKDMATRGRKPELTPQQKSDANVAKARDLIPGLKPGVDAPKVEPGRASAEAYQTQQRKDIPPVVGVDKNAPQSEGYKADLKYLNDHGGHATQIIDGKKTDVPLGTKGNYDDINPELAARLAALGREYEKQTGKKPKFGEASRGDDVQAIYWEESGHGTKYAAARPSNQGGRGSNHLRGTAMDIPPSDPFHGWVTQNKDKYGVHFPVSGDAPHIEMNRKYTGPAYAKETKEFGPGVIDTSKLPPMDTSKPKYTGTTEPPGGWPDSRLTTPADQIKMQTPPVTAPAAPPVAPGDSKITPELMSAIEKIESNGNPNLVNKYGYKGLFQLSDKQFADYGGKGSIFDPAENRRVAELVIADEVKRTEKEIGRPLTPHEIYLSHQQGSAGAAAHLKNPDQPAWKSMASTAEGREKGEDWAKRAIWDNLTAEAQKKFGSVDNVKSSDFVQFWKEEGTKKGIKDTASATAAAPAAPNQEVKVAGPPMAPPAPKPPADPYRKSRPAHDLLETSMVDLAKQHMPSMAGQAESIFGGASLRTALQHPLYGGMIKSRLVPELSKYGIEPAEFEKAITSPRPPPPPKETPTPAPTQASAPAPAAPPPLTPAEVKAAADAPKPTEGTWQGDLARTAGPGSPGTVEVPVPPPTTTEISVRPAPGPPEQGPAVGEARGGDAGATAPAALPAEDATEAAKPEGAGAGDSTMLPPVTVEEGATDAPGFYGAPPGTPLPDLPPGELNARWNERIYEATDRPTMARDERLGHDPHPSFDEFRRSENIDDQRLAPQLTAEQKAQYQAQSNSPKGQFRYTPAEHEAALAKTDTPLAREAGSKQIENLELNAAMKKAANVADGTAVVAKAAEEPPPAEASAEASAAEVAQAGPPPQAQAPPPQVTPEMAKALEAAVKIDAVPLAPTPPDAQPVLPSSQPGGPGSGLSLAPPGLQSIPTGATAPAGASAFMPASQGGSIALAGLAPAQSGVFSTPLLDAAAQQQPTIGQGNLAPFSWAAPMSWGWGGNSGNSGFGGIYSGGSAFDFGGGGGFSDLGGGLGSGMGFFGSSFGG